MFIAMTNYSMIVLVDCKYYFFFITYFIIQKFSTASRSSVTTFFVVVPTSFLIQPLPLSASLTNHHHFSLCHPETRQYSCTYFPSCALHPLPPITSFSLLPTQVLSLRPLVSYQGTISHSFSILLLISSSTSLL